jgi:hypothetical protein
MATIGATWWGAEMFDPLLLAANSEEISVSGHYHFTGLSREWRYDRVTGRLRYASWSWVFHDEGRG